jgi:hypothetical protein
MVLIPLFRRQGTVRLACEMVCPIQRQTRLDHYTQQASCKNMDKAVQLLLLALQDLRTTPET